MKLHSLAVIAILLSAPVIAQTIPDEINYQPYLERLRTIEGQIRQQENQISTINSDIEEARRFISESQNYIRQQEQFINESQAQIAENRSTIPQLQRQIADRRGRISQLERNRQALDSELAQLRNQEQALRTQLRPVEESMNRRAQQIRTLENELRQYQQEENAAGNRVNALSDRIRQTEADLARERAQTMEMRRELSQAEGRIQQLQQNLSSSEASLGQLQNNLRSEEFRLEAATQAHRQAQADLEALRRQGPSAEQIRAAENKVNQESARRDQAQASVNNIRGEIGRIQGQIAQLKSQQESLRRDIANLEPRIAAVQNQIRTLESSISSNQSSLSTEEGKLNGLNGRVAEYQGELDNLRAQGAPADQITAADRKLRAATAKRDETIQTIANLKFEIAKAQSQIPQLQLQIEQMRRDIPGMEARINQLGSQISTAESSLSQQQNSLRSEESRLEQASIALRQAQAELEAVRRQGPSPEQIAQAEARVRAADTQSDNIARNVTSIRQDITRTQAQVTQLRSQIDTERRALAALPNRIAQSEARERELTVRRQAQNQELNQAQGDLMGAQRRIETRVGQIRTVEGELRQEEAHANQLVQRINALVGASEQNRNAESNLRGNIQQLNQEVADLSQEERDRTADIPKLEAAIRQANADIKQSHSEIKEAQTQEAKLLQTLSQTQTRLAQTRTEASGASSQYQTRLTLFNQHLDAARSLGTSQVTNADDLGKKTGSALAKSKSAQVGQSMGKELGSSEGKLWALVRAEVQGWPKGYDLGRRSQEDIDRAASQATKKATDAAQAYAQTNLKPGFFNDHYLQELKRPVEKDERDLIEDVISLKMASIHSNNKALLVLEPITAEEIRLSQQTKTSLDANIVTSEKEVKQLIAKHASLAKPEVIYEVPATVPYGQVQCAQVYKGVQVYKDACADAYKKHFSGIYQDHAKQTFGAEYPSLYTTESRKIQLQSQQTQFSADFSGMMKITENEGLLKGKEDIFNETYTATYDSVYRTQLPIATDRANQEARVEVQQWVAGNAAMTISANALSKKVIRGGDEVKLIVDLKNVSPKDSNHAMLFKVVKPVNVEMPRLEYSQVGAKANSITKFEQISFKIPATARSGEKISFEIHALLPGHKFSNQRTETFKVEKTLAANPKLDVNANFDSTPNIRIIRFKTHTLAFTIKPTVEDIADGYEVELTPTEGANLINLSGSNLTSGALKKDQAKTFQYTYTFKKEAKGKKVRLKMTVKYLGEVVSESNVDMVPN